MGDSKWECLRWQLKEMFLFSISSIEYGEINKDVIYWTQVGCLKKVYIDGCYVIHDFQLDYKVNFTKLQFNKFWFMRLNIEQLRRYISKRWK